MIMPNNELQFASMYYFLNFGILSNDCNTVFIWSIYVWEKNDFETQCTVKKNNLFVEEMCRERDCKKLPNKVL